jgi:flagellar protein FliL
LKENLMAAAADPPSDIAANGSDVRPKKSRKPLIFGLILAVLGGAGGFGAVQFGLIGGGEADGDDHAESVAELPPIAPVAYVAVDPVVVNMPRDSGRQFLSFAVQLEVAPDYAAEVEALKPRIVDVINSFLRAVEPADFEQTDILVTLRAQLLRRIQVVSGEGRVRDLLVQEFILN